jgi:hypothetical protein
MAQSFVGMAIKDQQAEILARVPGLTPEAIDKARKAIAARKAAGKLKVAKPAAEAPAAEAEAEDEDAA